jgi:hypothetical protein
VRCLPRVACRTWVRDRALGGSVGSWISLGLSSVLLEASKGF